MSRIASKGSEPPVDSEAPPPPPFIGSAASGGDESARQQLSLRSSSSRTSGSAGAGAGAGAGGAAPQLLVPPSRRLQQSGSSGGSGASTATSREGDEEGRSGSRRPTWHVRATSNLQVEDTSLLRGMPLACGLRGLGSVFSSRPATARYYELSSPVERFDTFISHNWSTPRWRKFLVLALHFNIGLGFVMGFAVAVGACVLTALGVLPSVTGTVPLIRNEQVTRRGIFCLPLGTAALVLALCFVHELDFLSRRRCGRREVVFLDKTCVHQTLEDRKRAGIQCLAAFLARSDAFLVVYSDVYMQRLWTVYECASWLLLHPGEPIIVRPVLFPVLFLGALLVTVTWNAYYTIMHAAALTEYSSPLVTLVLVLAYWIAAWIMARLAEDQEAIEAQVEGFSLDAAKCASEDDRAVVQANIVAFMKLAKMSGPVDSEGQVLRAFEALVRREVPILMRSSSSGVGMPYRMAAFPMLPHLFGCLDNLVGFYLEGRAYRFLGLIFTMYCWFVFSIWPITLAFIAHATRRRCCRNQLACAGIGALSCLLIAAAWRFGEVAIAEAETSNIWFALLLPVYGFSFLTTWKLYRPPGLSKH